MSSSDSLEQIDELIASTQAAFPISSDDNDSSPSRYSIIVVRYMFLTAVFQCAKSWRSCTKCCCCYNPIIAIN